MAIREELYDDTGAQMEMAGLVSEPTDVDPVSGNEIPVGATAEGVRDDQTAAISPGEFVIPDYAVRYHGLDFYVGSLQKAQQGLGQMEDMGLVGNPDAQTIPEETPLPTMDTGEEEMPAPEMAGAEQVMSDTGKPMPTEMAGAEQVMSDTGEPMPTAEFQTGGVVTTPISAPIQQTSTPIAPPPIVDPIRPISTQPVPTTVPTPSTSYLAPKPLLTQYQQGYYVETGDGYYRYQGPPGTSSTAQAYTREQLPSGAVVAPKGTKSSDVWGGIYGQGYTRQSPYLALQGEAAGTPGRYQQGYGVEAYINEQGNIVYLTTVNGQVQGGIPPGYTKASREQLGFGVPRQEPRQVASVKPPDPVGDGYDPRGGTTGFSAGTTETQGGYGVGVESSYGASSIGTEVGVAVNSVNESLDTSTPFGIDYASTVAQVGFTSMEQVVDSGKHGYAAHGLNVKSSTAKATETILGMLAPTPVSFAIAAYNSMKNAPAQPAIAAAQVASTTASGNPYSSVPNSLGFGNFSAASVYGVQTPLGIITVTSHPTLSVDEVHAIDAIALGVNPYGPNYDVSKFTMNADGVPNGFTGTTDLIGVAEINAAYAAQGIGTGAPGSAGEAGGYTSDGGFVSNTGVVSAMGTAAAFAALTAEQQAAAIANRGRGHLLSIDETGKKASEEQVLDAIANKSLQEEGRLTSFEQFGGRGAASTANTAAQSAAAAASGIAAMDPNVEDVMGFQAMADAVAAQTADAGDADGADGKVICTALNSIYGFGIFRNAAWMKYNLMPKSYVKYPVTKILELGYHKIFGPLAEKMPYSPILTKVLRRIARVRTNRIRREMQGKPLTLESKVYTNILRPPLFIVGWLVSKKILSQYKIKNKSYI